MRGGRDWGYRRGDFFFREHQTSDGFSKVAKDRYAKAMTMGREREESSESARPLRRWSRRR